MTSIPWIELRNLRRSKALDQRGCGWHNPVWAAWLLALSVFSAAAVTITTQPTDQVVQLGDTATFSVNATDSGLVYIWFFNGAALSGQNASTLRLTNVKPQNVGVYYAQ